MAINAMESDTVSRACALAKLLVTVVKPEIDRLNIDYDTATVGVKATLTQEELDSVASFSGLTKAQLDDGLYAMTAILRQVLQNGAVSPTLEINGGSFSALEQLAVRA